MWITAEDCLPQQNKMYEFKKEFFVSENDASLTIRVSAEARYKLYLNGELILLGPCKGNEFCKYYETKDISDKLKAGANVLYARVLQLEDALGAPVPLVSVMRRGRLLFWLDGTLKDGGKSIPVGTAAGGWLARRDDGFEVTMPVFSTYGALCEAVNHGVKEKNPWRAAVNVEGAYTDTRSVNAYGEFCMCPLYARPIPELKRVKMHFKKTVKSSVDSVCGLTVPADTRLTVILDAGELTTGYLNIRSRGGAGAAAELMYSECFCTGISDGRYLKNIRDDESGFLAGDRDSIRFDGSLLDYETFWFKTFRFVTLEITTAEEPLLLEEVFYTETAYPADIKGDFRCSDEYFNRMWEISIRTLKRCMHETHEDCPYYEQLQYTMDTRLQTLFTYNIMEDTRLARRALEDFHASKTPDGLLGSRTPCIRPQIIPQFSLHFIFMLHDIYMYFGDINLIRRYMPTADGILNYFDSKTGKTGLAEDKDYWQYIDWGKTWDLGVPPAVKSGPLAVVNLIYVCALRCAAHINEWLGRGADEYSRRADRLLARVTELCFREDAGLYADGPDSDSFSSQTQLWAVLAGAENGAALMERTFEEKLGKPSYSMTFYLFRALEKSGIYDKYIFEKLAPWRVMIDKHCTTWTEDDVSERSECHAWGSAPIYEFAACILGVRPAKPGCGEILIEPHILPCLEFAEGTVITARGPVKVRWEKKGDEIKLSVSSPGEAVKKVILPGAEPYITTEKSFVICRRAAQSGFSF